ncbi:hypothetical protein J3R82DRAFT_7067 [Butyriboletus roseoflavus]|nr:hypothetical protein J3R82DRAFT_7067 [Butyriboletus roseoflavus]
MATLLRYRHDNEDDLQSSVPSPFPAHLLHHSQGDVLDELAAEPVDYDDTNAARVAQCQSDIQTSVAAVQHSCLMTLANILSVTSPAITAHPHDSECPSPNGASIPLEQVLAETPLSSLVHTLRARDGHRDRHDQPLTEAALLSQLHELIDAIVPSLDRRDAHLAQAIVALLIDLEQLPASLALTSAHLVSQSGLSQDSGHPSRTPYAIMASLQRQLSSLQPSIASTSGSRPTPMESVRSTLFWARIDEQLDTIVTIPISSRGPAFRISELEPGLPPILFDDALPPEYDSDYHHYPYEHPPSYVAEGHLYVSSQEKQTEQMRLDEQYPPEKILSRAQTSIRPAATEMTTERDHPMPVNSLDLDTIIHAIDRLYVVAPQLANQRVELRREKIVQMEKAKEGKGKARTLAEAADPELDKMLELLGRASAREIPDQSAAIDPHRMRREKGTANFEEQRRRYLEHLVHRTHTGRLHSQDAVPSLSRSYSSPSNAGGAGQVADDDQSSEVQLDGRGSRDGKRASYPAAPKSGSTLEPPTERSRSRSLSASHLAWLRPKDKSGNTTSMKECFSSLSRSPSLATSKSVRSFSGRLYGVGKSRPSSTGGEGASHAALDVAYVAEHHETLKHVLLFVAYASPSSSAPNVVPLAEVLPSTSSGTYGDCLFLRLAGTPSPPLALPVPVVPGPKTVLSRGSHWEVKASCYQSGVPPKESEDVSLLPASELASLSPLSYTCTSCSLPLIPAPPMRYRDLPSEHWEELIDAWVCHPEGQTLAMTGMHGGDGNPKGNGFGFWPTRDEALVGGSYLLFDAECSCGRKHQV